MPTPGERLTELEVRMDRVVMPRLERVEQKTSAHDKHIEGEKLIAKKISGVSSFVGAIIAGLAIWILQRLFGGPTT